MRSPAPAGSWAAPAASGAASRRRNAITRLIHVDAAHSGRRAIAIWPVAPVRTIGRSGAALRAPSAAHRKTSALRAPNSNLRHSRTGVQTIAGRKSIRLQITSKALQELLGFAQHLNLGTLLVYVSRGV
jgi:hypothetical protein